MADANATDDEAAGGEVVEAERMDETEVEGRSKPKIRPAKIWTIRVVLLAMVVYVAIYNPGTAITVIVCGVAIFYFALWILAWWIKRWFKKLGAKFEAGMETMGELKPVGSKAFPHAEQVAAIEKEFADLGFVPAGRYIGKDDDDYYFVALAHPQHRLYALISISEIFNKPETEIFAPLADGRILCAANQPFNYLKSLQRQPEHVYFPMLNRTPAEMVEWLLRHRPEGDHPETPPGLFRIFHASFVGAEKAWKEQREAEELEQKLRGRFAETSGWSASRWEKEQWRLDFVYDRHQRLTAWVEARLLSVNEDGPDGMQKALASPPWEECGLFATPREIVAHFVDTGQSKLTRAGTVDIPCPADVYLLPDDSSEKTESLPAPS